MGHPHRPGGVQRDPSLEAAVRVCLGHALLSAGRSRDSLCELERACQSPLLTGAERAEAQAWASFARLRLLDLDGAAAAAGEARSAAVAVRDHAATSIAMASLAVVSENRGSHPLELALAAEDAGAAFARQGNVARACQLLDQAITAYERLDAARDLARAEAALRQMGIRRGRHVTHRRAQSGWQSLTPSEQAVVDLVAEGLSNPQIGQRLYVSRRTVQTHLAHVFAKLHITSRAQLAAEAIRHRG